MKHIFSRETELRYVDTKNVATGWVREESGASRDSEMVEKLQINKA